MKTLDGCSILPLGYPDWTQCPEHMGLCSLYLLKEVKELSLDNPSPIAYRGFPKYSKRKHHTKRTDFPTTLLLKSKHQQALWSSNSSYDVQDYETAVRSLPWEAAGGMLHGTSNSHLHYVCGKKLERPHINSCISAEFADQRSQEDGNQM